MKAIIVARVSTEEQKKVYKWEIPEKEDFRNLYV